MAKYPGVPPYNRIDINDWAIYVTNTANNCLNGKTNNIGNVTLHTSTVSTTVTLASGRLGIDTVILFEPKTANAAGEIGAGGMFVSTKDPSTGKFVITHASNAQADRSFNFILVG